MLAANVRNRHSSPHPIVWTILYYQSGALNGFIFVALTFLATRNGLSITEGSFIVGTQAVVSWLKWIWAPVIDATLSLKRWFLVSALISASSLFLMTLIPLDREHLPLLLFAVVFSSIGNSLCGMSVEALIANVVKRENVGSASAWFQTGNLAGTGLGGALGLFLLEKFSRDWIAGLVMSSMMLSCCFALLLLPKVETPFTEPHKREALKHVMQSFWRMIHKPRGLLTGLLCVLPMATGAAQITLTQAAVAGFWGAGVREVGLAQGILSGFITALGCFIGGRICTTLHAHKAYLTAAFYLAMVTALMACTPHTANLYIAWSMLYALGLGISYSAFAAMALTAIGESAAATGYNVFASLSNFPFWWVGLVLGWTADRYGPRTMLLTETALGLVGIAIFAVALKFKMRRRTGRTSR